MSAQAKNLVIVESPAKAKTITKYLNGNKLLVGKFGTFMVMASYGHVRDLEKKTLGIDIEKGFKPNYVVTEEKKKTVNDLREKAAQCQMVWLASDFDREGEGIAMHLKEVLKLKKYKRITFTEITPKALENAVLNPRTIDEHLVDSQETRRILDRVVGFKLSPVLWKKYKTENMSGLSAGRVQSAVVNLIMEKELDIRNHNSQSYWHYIGDMSLKMQGQPAIPLEVKVYKDTTILKETSEAKAKAFLTKIKGDFKIREVKTKEVKRNADLPFITSTLQQDAYNKHGFTPKRTMQLAQELYEKGHITYMRTDSYNISEDFKADAEKFINATYGTHYWSGGSSKAKKKQKNVQEAHEAIRPTHADVKPTDLAAEFSQDHRKLYDMIWKRTIAFFMVPCVSIELDIKIADSSFASDTYFLSTFSRVKFNGYMVLYGAENENIEDLKKYVDNLSNPSKYKITCKNVLAKNTWSSPPQRYSESSIIKVLESEGIGRPSTYANIMTKLFDKKYIIKSDVTGIEKPVVNYVYDMKKLTQQKDTATVGAERTKLVPTSIGEEINSFLNTHFQYVVDKSFTSNMEADLDKIAEGDKTGLDVLKGFWKVFGKDVAQFDHVKDKKVVLKTESLQLHVDGGDYILRQAKYGPVIEYANEASEKKKSYINLKPYLKQFRKELTDLTEDDVRMLVNMPRKLCVIDKKDFLFAYGPYGFYGKYDDRNIKLAYKTINSILAGDECDAVMIKSIKASIDYVPTPKPK